MRYLLSFLALALASSLSVPAFALDTWTIHAPSSGALRVAQIPTPRPRPHVAAPAKPKQMTTAQATTNPIAVLQAFTTADLQAALADATANQDTLSVTCYNALIPLVSSNVSPLSPPSGAFSAFQKARDLKTLLANLQSSNGPLASLNVACAPLILDTQNTLLGLGIIGGAIAGKIAIPVLP